MNILIIGMDGRSANYGPGRPAPMPSCSSGVNLLATRTAQVLSIPRDLWVQIPEVGINPLHEKSHQHRLWPPVNLGGLPRRRPGF